MTKEEKIKYLKDFANFYQIDLEIDGECGFGRPCVGLSKNEQFIAYNPYKYNGSDIVFIDDLKMPEGFSDIKPSSAYHKFDCFVVLKDDEKNESTDKAIDELYEWVFKLKELGELKLTTYKTGVTGMQALVTPTINYCFIVNKEKKEDFSSITKSISRLEERVAGPIKNYDFNDTEFEQKNYEGKLTKQVLNMFQDGEVMASGYGYIEHPWHNDAVVSLEPDGISTKVKFVMIKNYNGFKMYHSLDANFIEADYLDDTSHLLVSFDRVLKGGSHVRPSDVKKLIEVDDNIINKFYKL